MRFRNTIEVLSFDFAFASAATARAHHDDLADRARDRGVRIVDEVLGDFSGPEQVSIDRLDLDLGIIAIGDRDFEIVLRARLHAALGNALSHAAVSPLNAELAGGQPSLVASRDTSETALDDLWHLLHTGTLPWWHRDTTALAIDALVDRVLADSGAALAERLHAAPNRLDLLARIERQWTRSQRFAIGAFVGQNGTTSGPWPKRSPGHAVDGPGETGPAFIASSRPDPLHPISDRTTGQHHSANPAAIGEPAIGLTAQANSTSDDAMAHDALTAGRWSGGVFEVASGGSRKALADRLLRLAGDRQWRRTFANALDADRTAAVLALWFPHSVAMIVAQVVHRSDWWQPADRAGPQQGHLVAWLVDALAAADEQEPDAATLLAGVALARAQADAIGPDAVMGAVLAALERIDGTGLLNRQLVAQWRVIRQGTAVDERPPIFASLLAAESPAGAFDHTNWMWGEWASGVPSHAAIEALLQTGFLEARPLLSELAAQPGWSTAVSSRADQATWYAILALGGLDPCDFDLIRGFVAALTFMQDGRADADIQARIDADLLANLFAGDGSRPAVAALLDTLLTNEAVRRGLSPARLARSAVITAPSIIRAALRDLFGDVAGLVASTRAPAIAAEEARSEADRAFDRALSAGRWPVESFGELAADAPIWLAGRLSKQAADGQWRSAFSSVLDSARSEMLLGLWLPANAAAAVARLVQWPTAWQAAGQPGPEAARLAGWLLDALFTGTAPNPDPAALVEAIAIARARDDGLDPRTVTAAVLAALDQLDGAAPLQRQLAARWTQRPVTAHDPTDARRHPSPLRATTIAWLLAPDRTGDETQFALQAIEALGSTERRRLLETLTPGRAVQVFATLDRISDLRLPPIERSLEEEWPVLRAALFGNPMAFDPAAFAKEWAGPSLDQLDPDARAIAEARITALDPPASTRSTERVSDFTEIPEGAFPPGWVVSLPRVLPDAQRDRLMQALRPARTGVARLAGLTEAECRALLQRIDPATGPALLLIDMFNAHWCAVGLPEADAATEARRSNLTVLQIVFEQARGFDRAALATNWLKRRLAAADTATRFETLASPSTILDWQAGRAPARAALLLALRDAGIDTRMGAAFESTQAFRPAAASPDVTHALPGEGPKRTLHVGNAGIVLLGPYIAPLFERLHLVVEGSFRSTVAANRGAHLLEVMVDGVGDALEPRLILNKLLCGIDLHQPVDRDFTASDEECLVVEGLLEAVIANWGRLGGTSVSGLRGSFLQRNGMLVCEEGAWHLTVEARPYDVLIDAIPWGFRTLRLPWMEAVLHVDWR